MADPLKASVPSNSQTDLTVSEEDETLSVRWTNGEYLEENVHAASLAFFLVLEPDCSLEFFTNCLFCINPTYTWEYNPNQEYYGYTYAEYPLDIERLSLTSDNEIRFRTFPSSCTAQILYPNIEVEVDGTSFPLESIHP